MRQAGVGRSIATIWQDQARRHRVQSFTEKNILVPLLLRI